MSPLGIYRCFVDTQAERQLDQQEKLEFDNDGGVVCRIEIYEEQPPIPQALEWVTIYSTGQLNKVPQEKLEMKKLLKCEDMSVLSSSIEYTKSTLLCLRPIDEPKTQ